MCEAFVHVEDCRLRCYTSFFSSYIEVLSGEEKAAVGCFAMIISRYVPYKIFKIHALHTKIKTT